MRAQPLSTPDLVPRPRTDPVVVFRRWLALAFTLCFMAFALYLCLASAMKFAAIFSNDRDPVETLIKAINLGVVGIAIFELSVNVHQEYVVGEHHADFYRLLRRSLSRFIGVVCVALALEGLMMTIKYSQLDLAGNLYYPVAVILSTAALLLSLSVFLHMTAGLAGPPGRGD